MGMEKTIAFTGPAPSWTAIHQAITTAGLPVALRMIDGLPAFPDEMPDDGWKELRLSTPAGMMTLRLQPSHLSLVVWGNADEQLNREWEIVARACGEVTSCSAEPHG